MAGSAVIGNLRVNLGIDSAEFSNGAKKAQSTLAGLTGSLKKFAEIAGIGLSFAGVEEAIRRTIDHMDELGKASQKIGIPVEDLSKLEYAAKLSNISLEDLTTTLGRFSKNLVDIQGGGKSDASRALSAIGVSATDANGRLKPTTEILDEIADRFVKYRDGANKTAIAIALFGKAGAQMIPLLNQGSKAIKDQGDELERFGGVTREDAAAAAEHFNDNLTRLHTAMYGVTVQVVEHLLPSFVHITDAMVEFAKVDAAPFFDRMNQEIEGTIAELSAIIGVIEKMQGLWDEWQTKADASKNMPFVSGGRAGAIPNPNYVGNDNQGGTFLGTVHGGSSVMPPFGPNNPIQTRPPGLNLQDAPGLVIPPAAASSAHSTARAYDDLAAAAKRVYEDTRTPLEQYQSSMKELDTLLNAGKINTDTYNRAVKQLQDQWSESSASMQDSMAGLKDMMDTVSADLSSGFASAVGGLIDGTTSIKDAFTSMVESIVRDVSDLFLNQAFKSLFSGSSGTGGGLLGSLFGGFSGLYAGGGSIGAGQWGIAGEAGPEVVRGPASVIPMSAMGDGSRAINITISGATGNREVVDLVNQGVQSGLRQYDRNRPRADIERQLRTA